MKEASGKKYIKTTQNGHHDRSWQETYKSIDDALHGIKCTYTGRINPPLDKLEVSVVHEKDSKFIVCYKIHVRK